MLLAGEHDWRIAKGVWRVFQIGILAKVIDQLGIAGIGRKHQAGLALVVNLCGECGIEVFFDQI